jgi:hypothetical protein
MKKKIVKEDAPTNSVGTSSSIAGTGAVDTYDPLLTKKIKKISRVLKRFKDLKPKVKS